VFIDEDVAAAYRYYFPKYQYSCRRLGKCLGLYVHVINRG
jgi:hypothetical protein